MQVGDSVELKDGTKGKVLVVHPGGRQVYVELENTLRVTRFSADLTVIDPAADLRNMGIDATATEKGIEVKVPQNETGE
jgi:hypothetical protein